MLKKLLSILMVIIKAITAVAFLVMLAVGWLAFFVIFLLETLYETLDEYNKKGEQ